MVRTEIREAQSLGTKPDEVEVLFVFSESSDGKYRTANVERLTWRQLLELSSQIEHFIITHGTGTT